MGMLAPFFNLGISALVHSLATRVPPRGFGSGILFLSLSLSLIAQSTDVSDEAFWESIYEDHRVLEIDILLTDQAWQSMQPVRNERDFGPPRGGVRREPGVAPYPYVKANLSIDGQRFENAGLRFKGNSSYRFARNGFKRPLKIDTNRFVKGQKIHGRSKLNLSNSFLDPAFMKEKLAYEVYRAAGMPTPGVGWARVTLTIEGKFEKRPLGVYVLVEQVDQRFIKKHFGEATKGSLLMKPETASNWRSPIGDSEWGEPYGIKFGEGSDVLIRRFEELQSLIHGGREDDFEREVHQRMDLDLLAGYLAATSLLVNIDSYIGMPHNYYLFVGKGDGRLRLLPWDLNESFGTFTMGSTPEALVDWDIDRPWVSEIKLLRRLFEMESFQKRYRSAVVGLMKTTFTEEKLFGRIAAFEKALVRSLGSDDAIKMRMGIEGDSRGYNAAVGRRVFAIKPFIRKRIASVKNQLLDKSHGTKLREGRHRNPGPKKRDRPRRLNP